MLMCVSIFAYMCEYVRIYVLMCGAMDGRRRWSG